MTILDVIEQLLQMCSFIFGSSKFLKVVYQSSPGSLLTAHQVNRSFGAATCPTSAAADHADMRELWCICSFHLGCVGREITE